MKKIILLTLALFSLNCNAQKKGENKMKTTEKFNKEYYLKKLNGLTYREYEEDDGTQIRVYLAEEYDVVVKVKPKSFVKESKVYYKTGSLKEEGQFFYCSNIKIGIRREYDEQGNLIKETDYDKQFKDLCMKPNDVLNRLELEGYIDRKTGKGQEKLRNTDSFISIGFGPAQKGKTIFDPHEPAVWAINIYGYGMCITHSFNAENCEYLGKQEIFLDE